MSAALNMPRRIQGEQRFQIASKADRCANWLKVNGFEVLSVEASRITIKASPLCDKLEGVVEGFARNRKGEQRYKMASRHDCAVVWNVTPPKPDSAVVSLFKRLVSRIGGAA